MPYIIILKKGKVDPEFRQDTIKTLQELAWELIDWPIDNLDRIDIHLDYYLDRQNAKQIIELLPYNEIIYSRWNSNPFDINPTGSGKHAADPGVYTFPYWFCVWSQFFNRVFI